MKTEIPVLVPDENGRDGYAHFFSRGTPGYPKTVRKVTTTEIKKRLKTIVDRSEIKLFHGLIQLNRALEARDELQVREAYEKIWPWLKSVSHVPAPGWTDKDAMTFFSKNVSVTADRYQIALHYSELVTTTFENARLVMWYSDKNESFVPAIYCPDWRCAAFVGAFLGNLLICPNDNKLFVPKDDGKNAYCTLKCQNAYRQKRFRFREGLRKAKQEKSKR
jgi:hypothetical protein